MNSQLIDIIKHVIPGCTVHVGTTVAFVRLGDWEGLINLSQPIDGVIQEINQLADTYKLEIKHAAKVKAICKQPGIILAGKPKP